MEKGEMTTAEVVECFIDLRDAEFLKQWISGAWVSRE